MEIDDRPVIPEVSSMVPIKTGRQSAVLYVCGNITDTHAERMEKNRTKVQTIRVFSPDLPMADDIAGRTPAVGASVKMCFESFRLGGRNKIPMLTEAVR